MYEEFIKDYPDSFWLEEAKVAINNIEYQFNSGIQSPEEFETENNKDNNEPKPSNDETETGS